MNSYNFTDRVRRVLQMAREEAARLRHEYVGTEHMLLGLIREGEGVGAAVLTNLNVDLEGVKEKIEEMVKEGTGSTAGPDLPYTSRGKKVLELAMSEARGLRGSYVLSDSYVGTEHLLLGLLREEKGIAAQVLMDAGLNEDMVRAETKRLLGDSAHGSSESRPSSLRQAPRSRAERRAELLLRASELVQRLLRQPPPDANDTQMIATELNALIAQLSQIT
jgi:ATP-dependent Clp protease ATP-binding subunit ClpC